MKIFSRIRHSRILKRQSISEAALIITIITFLSKIVGYAREVLVAYYFGATAQTDAFLIAFLVPSMVLGLIAGGLQVVIIPVYTEKKKKDPAIARLFVNQIFFITGVSLFALSIVMYLFPTFFIKIVAYGFKGNRLTLATYFMRYLIIFGFFNIFIGFFTGIYQTEKQFLYPAVVGLIGNCLVPVSLVLLTPMIGINSWTVGEIAFSTFAFLALFIVLRTRKGFFKAFALKHIDWKEMRYFGALLFPIILTSSLATINRIVDRTVASSLAFGSIAILNFAQKIYLIPIGLLATSLNVSVYPTFSSFATEKNHKGYATVFQQSIIFTMFIMLPISAAFIALSQPIVKILFQHGAFTQSATTVTAFAVSMYSIGLFVLAANDLLRRAFFSFKDTKTPLYLSAIIVAINIAGNLILSRFFGVGGIALATTIAATFGFFLYIYALRKKHYIQGMSYRPIIKEGFKIISISFFTGIIAFLLKNYINSATLLSMILRFVLVSLFLTVIYLLLTYLFHSQGFALFSNYVKKFLHKLRGI